MKPVQNCLKTGLKFYGLKSSSVQHDVHFVNYGPVYSKIDNKLLNSVSLHLFLA